MADDFRSSGTFLQGAAASMPAGSAGFTPSAMVQSLIGLRQRVLERLDELETLVQDRPQAGPDPNRDGQVELLERKQVALEEVENRLRAQAERQDREWAALLTQLEADRRLLAEAWDRIEQERIAATGIPMDQMDVHGSMRSAGQGIGLQRRAAMPMTSVSTRLAARSTSAESDAYHATGQEILRQFQTLCSDVRRNAEERRDSRDKGRRAES